MSISNSRPSYHHGDLRNALLDAGREVAGEVGAEALSLREVARRAGVSHTAAYNHFVDKNDLLRAVAIRAFGELTAEMTNASQGGTLDDLGAAYVRFALAHPAEFRFMFQRSLCMPDGVFDPLEEASRATEAVLREHLIRLQAEGALRAGDVDELTLVVWSQVHGLTAIVLETPALKNISVEGAEHLVRQGLRLLAAGIG